MGMERALVVNAVEGTRVASRAVAVRGGGMLQQVAWCARRLKSIA